MHARHVFAFSLSLLVCATALPGQRDKRGYVAGKYALELDGKSEGFVSSMAGGNPTSDVVIEKLGPDNIAHKHIAGVKYDPIVFEANSELAATALQMLLDGKMKRVSGAVISADYNYKATNRLNFMNALVTAVTIPDLDAASKDACRFEVEITPEITRTAPGGGADLKGEAVGKGGQVKCVLDNFKVDIPGIDAKRVSKVEGFTIRRTFAENAVGEMRTYQKEPGRLDVPNIKLTVSDVGIKDFADWLDDFVVKGNNGQDKEKTLTLAILNPSAKESLLTLTASGVGIVSIRRVPAPAGNEALARSEVELYVEQWTMAPPTKRASLDRAGPRAGAVLPPSSEGAERPRGMTGR